MRRILVMGAAAITAPAWAAPECGTQPWHAPLTEAAARFELPLHWLQSVMRVESAGCVQFDGRPTTSVAGAMGLMQLMPATWATYRARLALGDDPHDPRDNILAGAAYLRDLYDRYGTPGMFAAYHAGPGRYDDSVSASRALPRATLDYLARLQALGVPTQHDSDAVPVVAEDATSRVFVARAVPAAVFVRLPHAPRRGDVDAAERTHVQSE